MINKCAEFTIDTINAGNGTLSAHMHGVKGSDKVAAVQTENQRGSCTCAGARIPIPMQVVQA